MGEAGNNAVREFSYRWSRFVADFPCQLQIEGESQEEAARCVDISEGGMAIRTPANLQLGMQVLVNVQFPGSSGSVTLRTRVVGARNQEYGLCFGASSADEKETVRLFLSSLKLETFPHHPLP